ncbi:MAG: hypothetical protein U0930_09835 [Pirellulales bacterium]
MDENRKRYRQDKAKGKYSLSGLTMCGQCGAAYCSRMCRAALTNITTIAVSEVMRLE